MQNSSPSQGSVSIGSTIKLITTISGTAGVVTNRTFNMSPFKTMRVTWNSFGRTASMIGLISVYMDDANRNNIYYTNSKNKINKDGLIFDVDISNIKEQAFIHIRSYSSSSLSGGEITKIEFLL